MLVELQDLVQLVVTHGVVLAKLVREPVNVPLEQAGTELDLGRREVSGATREVLGRRYVPRRQVTMRLATGATMPDSYFAL